MQNLSEGARGKHTFREICLTFSNTFLLFWPHSPSRLLLPFLIAIPQPSFPQNLLIEFSMYKLATQFCIFPFFSLPSEHPFSYFESTHKNIVQTWNNLKIVGIVNYRPNAVKNSKKVKDVLGILSGLNGKMYVSGKTVFPSLVLVIQTSFPKQIIRFFMALPVLCFSRIFL